MTVCFFSFDNLDFPDRLFRSWQTPPLIESGASPMDDEPCLLSSLAPLPAPLRAPLPAPLLPSTWSIQPGSVLVMHGPMIDVRLQHGITVRT